MDGLLVVKRGKWRRWVYGVYGLIVGRAWVKLLLGLRTQNRAADDKSRSSLWIEVEAVVPIALKPLGMVFAAAGD